MRLPALRALLVALALAAACAGARPATPGGRAAGAARDLKQAIIAAEDARGGGAAGLVPILRGLEDPDETIQAIAVRALGRLERPVLAPRIMPLLAAPASRVRAEAAVALARIAWGARPPASSQASVDSRRAPLDAATLDSFSRALAGRLRIERDPATASAVAASLARLPYGDEISIRAAETALMARAVADEGVPAVRVGVAGGLETLARLHGRKVVLAPATLEWLRDAVRSACDTRDAGEPGLADRVRLGRLALAALVSAGAVDDQTRQRARAGADEQLRRLAVGALAEPPRGRPALAAPPASERAAIGAALADPSAMVRYDALRAYGRLFQATDCAPVRAAVSDPSPHVSLLAIDLLGNGCRADPGVAAFVAAIADSLFDTSAAGGRAQAPATGEALANRVGRRTWHAAAHALVSLAKLAGEPANERLPRFATHPTWQVRMYAARAAAIVSASSTLRHLAGDRHDNVAEAALAGLSRVEGHGADDLYLAALQRTDVQLVRTAARALEGTRAAGATPALLAALVRLTRLDSDTTRDARVTLLDRIAELGSRADVAALVPLLRDPDPVVGGRAAEAVAAWTGRTPPVTPVVRRSRVPLLAELDRLGRSRVRVVMRGGSSFTLRLFVEDAPASAGRFAALVRLAYYDGLTFHRVVPNFALQGGSPGANEFMGDRLFMRDELGLSNLRGTVGVSTRGRDTGDAQFFVNLVDNVRLDMDYTVFAAVVDGMDVVDGIVEGDVIERIEIDQGSGIGDQGSGVAARWPRALTGLLRRGSCILMPDC